MAKLNHVRVRDLEKLASGKGIYRGPNGSITTALRKSKLPPEAPIAALEGTAHEEEAAALLKAVEADPVLAKKAKEMDNLRKDMDEAETGIVELMRRKAVKALLVAGACGGAILAAVHYLREDMAHIAVGLSVMFALVAANILDKSPKGLDQKLQKKLADAENGLKQFEG